ncbi:MAG: hypothetical protein R2705_22840 [Ilumatobacteraceae bacterium]
MFAAVPRREPLMLAVEDPVELPGDDEFESAERLGELLVRRTWPGDRRRRRQRLLTPRNRCRSGRARSRVGGRGPLARDAGLARRRDVRRGHGGQDALHDLLDPDVAKRALRSSGRAVAEHLRGDLVDVLRGGVGAPAHDGERFWPPDQPDRCPGRDADGQIRLEIGGADGRPGWVAWTRSTAYRTTEGSTVTAPVRAWSAWSCSSVMTCRSGERTVIRSTIAISSWWLG